MIDGDGGLFLYLLKSSIPGHPLVNMELGTTRFWLKALVTVMHHVHGEAYDLDGRRRSALFSEGRATRPNLATLSLERVLVIVQCSIKVQHLTPTPIS